MARLRWSYVGFCLSWLSRCACSMRWHRLHTAIKLARSYRADACGYGRLTSRILSLQLGSALHLGTLRLGMNRSTTGGARVPTVMFLTASSSRSHGWPGMISRPHRAQATPPRPPLASTTYVATAQPRNVRHARREHQFDGGSSRVAPALAFVRCSSGSCGSYTRTLRSGRTLTYLTGCPAPASLRPKAAALRRLSFGLTLS
jgi:hypothetical protein